MHHEGKSWLYYDGAIQNLPDGNWQIIGFLSELTEADKEGIVEKLRLPCHNGKFINYNNINLSFNNSSESLNSLLQSNNVLLVNPFERPDQYDDYYRDANGIKADWFKDYEKYQSAEQTVYKNPIILKRI